MEYTKITALISRIQLRHSHHTALLLSQTIRGNVQQFPGKVVESDRKYQQLRFHRDL
jgi:hypothetical protein